MFKNIQKYLLINYSLLWNLKIVPIAATALAFNILFFIIGYANGAIDFTETDDNYLSNRNDGTAVFFGVLLAFLIAVIWLVFYFKNNAYKSFYPIKKFSLFSEWALLLCGALLICTFSFSYFYGKDTKVRSYFTKDEAVRRCKVLSVGAFFMNKSGYVFNEYVTADSASTIVNVRVDSFNYRGHKYHVNSLMNKNIKGFQFTNQKQDSLLRVRIKDWLVHNQKDSVQAALQQYMKIAKEHYLPANITAEQSTGLVYDYPDFMRYKEIGTEEREYYNPNQYDYENRRTQIDTANQYLKVIGNDQYIYNKYFVPAEQLNHSYDTIARSWVNPTADAGMLRNIFYAALAFSIAVFSFRATSGRNWLIALISFGVLNMLTGLFSAMAGTEKLYLYVSCIIAIAIIIYFFATVASGKGKNISGVVLNVILWILPIILPLLFYTGLEIAKYASGYYSYDLDYEMRRNAFPTITMLIESYELVFLINIPVVILMMLYLSVVIKKWKGLAES
ncbi:hypothetical protein [Flavobacterium sp. 3HN19-14]|uniref:hypothetical protein n=1 Tax=Flavobacterium sp. 3HN19-14 TaxID=3448133 RepID=UPI003EE1002A